MYLYNISIIVEDSANAEALNWIKTSFLPSLASEYTPKLLAMLDSPHEGHTYSLQLIFNDRNSVEKFKDQHLTQLQSYLGSNHPERAFIFDSLMQYMQH
ncbi:DUF4286 family protein [Sphingobacterium corticis]|uniref:DUF4286 family protein n=1 Tax=Sphingobacterium corticis TaxID=1812823 RepID=A0ABW5NPT2_9SPHI